MNKEHWKEVWCWKFQTVFLIKDHLLCLFVKFGNLGEVMITVGSFWHLFNSTKANRSFLANRFKAQPFIFAYYSSAGWEQMRTASGANMYQVSLPSHPIFSITACVLTICVFLCPSICVLTLSLFAYWPLHYYPLDIDNLPEEYFVHIQLQVFFLFFMHFTSLPIS